MIDLKLRIFLADNRMTNKKFSQLTGIRESTVAAYVNDTYKMIPKDHIEKMCEVFNCTPGDLFKYIPSKE